MAHDTSPRGVQQLRQITEVNALRALAHPVRLALHELLSVQGPLTATEAGAKLGETATTCSFHLRQLARYGFVEEAGGGKGRARPWRVLDEGLRLSGQTLDGDAAVAASTVSRLFRETQLARLQAWKETSSSYPEEWRGAASDAEVVLWLTAAELRELNDELLELLLSRFRERRSDPSVRPKDAMPVELLLFNYPMTPPPGGNE